MAEIQPPFPSSGSFIKESRKSCRDVRIASNIKIDQDAIESFLDTLSKEDFDRLKSQHGVSFPLRFPSLASEVNFLAILSLLNTLSGYRVPLHKATGRGAYQNVLKLLFGLYITGADDGDPSSGANSLSANGLRSISPQLVADVMQVSLHEEKAHESIPGLVVGTRGGDINEVVELIVKVCKETGERLIKAGYPSLGVLVLEAISGAEKITKEKGDVAGAEYFVEQIVKAIPGFADMALVEGSQPVYVFKKVYFLLFALHQRLSQSNETSASVGEKSAAPTNMPKPSTLPMFVDNVLPTMLVHLGIVDLTGCSSSQTLKEWGLASEKLRKEYAEGRIPETSVVEGPRLTLEDAYRVRGSCLDAGLEVVKRAHQLSKQEQSSKAWMAEMTEADLDGYLWSVAKDDPALRKVPRMVERGTVMY
ncbi:hypothetical protein IE53DRAFT_383097 [Violaceomyces palustris]|uniref:Uncharacterized protein n=1 Tax=Violaceomyces palustris TaxID=1673888 RepID=A0ACD0P838_9BASI|nr:hypothetical protein IE53DRAFT_383097 [Violaceomyces palustris]